MDDDVFGEFNHSVKYYGGVFGKVTAESHPAIRKLARAYVAECKDVVARYEREHLQQPQPGEDASEAEWEEFTDDFISNETDAHNEIGAECHFLWHDVYRKRMNREMWRVAGRTLCVVARFHARILGIFYEVHYRPGNQGAAAAAADWGLRVREG